MGIVNIAFDDVRQDVPAAERNLARAAIGKGARDVQGRASVALRWIGPLSWEFGALTADEPATTLDRMARSLRSAGMTVKLSSRFMAFHTGGKPASEVIEISQVPKGGKPKEGTTKPAKRKRPPIFGA